MFAKKLSILFVFALLALTSFSAKAFSIRLDPDVDDFVVTATTDTTYSLGVTESSGDASSESAPAKIYVPAQRTGASYGNENFFLLKAKDKVKNYIFDVSNNAHVIKFPLNIVSTQDDYYLFVAIKNTHASDSKYKIAKIYSTSPVTPKNETFNVTFPVSLKTICDVIESDCNALVSGSSAVTKKFLAYFFYRTSNSYTVGDEIDPATDKDGLYFEVNISNKVPDSVEIVISDVKKGDKRVVATYTGSASISDVKSIRVFDRTAEGSLDSSPRAPGEAGVNATIQAKEYPFTQSGSITINDLVNGQNYYLSIGFVDKYNFSTKLSPSFEASPMEIEELLKKEQCFLLTAGFGEEHFVIDYFRHIRDHYLRNFALGRAFIKVYYTYGPKFATDLYEHDTLRASVRGTAYVMYFIFNNFTLILAALVFFASYLFKINKIKLKNQQIIK